MKKVAALLALALAAVALVACGGDDDDDTTTTGTTTEATQEGGGAVAGGEGAAAGEAGGSTFKVAAVPDTGLAYTTTEATAKAGDLTIEFENPQTLTHDVAIEDANGEEIGKTDLIADDTTTATIKDVKPGKYTFYCTVPGHREGGMEGTLTVK